VVQVEEAKRDLDAALATSLAQTKDALEVLKRARPLPGPGEVRLLLYALQLHYVALNAILTR
jgi:hypothetical protein